MKAEITGKPIDINDVIQAATRPEAGALCLFLGTVRNATANKAVTRLEYDAYDSMAVSETKKIIAQAHKKWEDIEVAIVHRKGILDIGDVAVAIAVSAPHRAASFEACRYIIDTLKKTVPIWKKEVFEDGEEWVAAHP